jgi:hypothetical protein
MFSKFRFRFNKYGDPRTSKLHICGCDDDRQNTCMANKDFSSAGDCYPSISAEVRFLSSFAFPRRAMSFRTLAKGSFIVKCLFKICITALRIRCTFNPAFMTYVITMSPHTDRYGFDGKAIGAASTSREISVVTHNVRKRHVGLRLHE